MLKFVIGTKFIVETERKAHMNSRVRLCMRPYLALHSNNPHNYHKKYESSTKLSAFSQIIFNNWHLNNEFPPEFFTFTSNLCRKNRKLKLYLHRRRVSLSTIQCKKEYVWVLVQWHLAKKTTSKCQMVNSHPAAILELWFSQSIHGTNFRVICMRGNYWFLTAKMQGNYWFYFILMDKSSFGMRFRWE